jgi:GT2 family glycosyltransferase
MDFSVIIVNYNTKDLTTACLDSIFQNLCGDFEVIVVDNNSTDGSADFLKEKFDSKIKIIPNSINLGFGKANNLAAAKAQGKFLFFLNSDTLIKEDVLNAFLICLTNPAVGILAPDLILTDGQKQKYASGEFPRFFNLLAGKIGIRKVKGLDWVSGAALVVRKEVFDQVGGFDEKYFMYFEDIDFCWSVKLAGYKIELVPTAKVIHLGGKSLSLNKERKKNYYQSQDYFYYKHYGNLARLCLKIMRSFYRLSK